MQYLNIIKTRTHHPKVMRCYQSRQVDDDDDELMIMMMMMMRIMMGHPKVLKCYQSWHVGNEMDVIICHHINMSREVNISTQALGLEGIFIAGLIGKYKISKNLF